MFFIFFVGKEMITGTGILF